MLQNELALLTLVMAVEGTEGTALLTPQRQCGVVVSKPVHLHWQSTCSEKGKPF